jgi:hypothetical protein
MLRVNQSWTRRSIDTYAKSPGARMSYHVARTRSLSLQAFMCSSCGSVDVYWNGKRIRTISLYTPRAGSHLLPVASFSGMTSGDVLLVTRDARFVAVSGLATRGF